MAENQQSEKEKLEEFNDLPNIFEDLPEEEQLVLNELPPKQKKEIGKILLQKHTQITSTSFSGPLPHPSLLQGYESVIKGGAERILKMAENQAEHRMSIEKTVVGSQMKQSERGQHYGLGISILCLIIGTVMAFFSLTAVAIALFTTTIVGLATVFVVGRRNKNTNKKEE